MSSIEEYPFIFINTPASLQHLASTEVALMLWRYKYANSSHSDDFGAFLCQEFSCEEILVVGVPSRIKAAIDRRIVVLGDELIDWKRFHLTLDIFGEYFSEAIPKGFKHIVADFSGSIGYKATATNMLDSGEFSDDVCNYKIACALGLADHVRRFYPSVEHDSRIDERCTWSDKMPIKHRCHSCKLHSWNACTHRRMYWRETKCHLDDDGTAFAYYCKMLPDDYDRKLEIISCIEQYSYSHNWIRSLPTLNRALAVYVFKKVPCQILKALIANEQYFPHVNQFLTLMRQFVSEDDALALFKSILPELWEIAFVCGSKHCGLNYSRCDQINELLLETWSDAPDEWKDNVSSNRDFFSSSLRSPIDNDFVFSSHYGHDMTFMLDLLNRWSSSDKEQFWRKNWPHLALRAKPSQFEQMMRSCLPDDNAVEEFKPDFCTEYFTNLFESFIEHGLYSDLKDYLKLICWKDANHFQSWSVRILQSRLDIIIEYDDDKYAEFNQFVDELSSMVEIDPDEFKTQMVISSTESMLHLINAACKHGANGFLSKINRFVTREENFQLIKLGLSDVSPGFPILCNCKLFSPNNWQWFLEWSIADQQKISAFKRELNMDFIFHARLSEYFIFKLRDEVFDFLQKFFVWYFVNEEDEKNFQFLRIIKENYEQFKSECQVQIYREDHYNIEPVYESLEKLFDCDAENLREFCHPFWRFNSLVPLQVQSHVREPKSSYYL